MEEAPEDAGGSPSLFQLCARTVTANMARLEEEVWGLPAVILQGLLPLLNIYYLEGIEAAAQRKGLSTQPVWRKLWNDVMKNKPTRLMAVPCWRKKFLETFFHSVLRGALDVASDWRLSDPRFCPLALSARHVSELTIFGKQQGVLELPPAVMDSLASSVESVKFLHLRKSDATTQRCLTLALHRLIHHGRVHRVSVLSWPRPDPALLRLILGISAGCWQEVEGHPCALCAPPPDHASCPAQSSSPDHASSCPAQSSSPDHASSCPAQSSSPDHASSCPAQSSSPDHASSCPAQSSSPDHASSCPDPTSRTEEETGGPSALLSLQPLNISHSGAPDTQDTRAPQQDDKAPSTSCDRPGPPADLPSEAGDLYDLIFSVPSSGQSSGPTEDEEEANPGAPFLQSAARFRSVRALNLHNLVFTAATCHSLCQLLRSWVTLERLTMAYIDLRTNIVPLMAALSDLARDPRCRLSAFSMSDFSTYIGTLDLAQLILRTFPGLQTLLLCYDLEENSDKVDLGAEPAEFAGNDLKQLDLHFPHTPLQAGRLLSVLRASPALLELSLDNAILQPGDVKRVLRTISEYNTRLRRLSFHDLNLSDTQADIVHLLQHSSLEEIKFSFCRLFERGSQDFVPQILAALKRNAALKVLKLNGNRLGNKGLVALADLYAVDSVSSIHYLDVSSNCITAGGLLSFAEKLEGREPIALRQLLVTQNGLDVDAGTTHKALKILEGVCRVVKDGWDPSHAFADHVSVM